MPKLILFTAPLLALALQTLASNAAIAQQRELAPLPPLEAKLYTSIAGWQLRPGAVEPMYAGQWAFEADLGPTKFTSEPNAFLTAKQLLALREVGQYYRLPWFSQIAAAANANLFHYIQDAQATHEPLGTIAYYPIVDHSTGRRGANTPQSDMIPFFNVPNDFDSSSQAFQWFAGNDRLAAYADGFAKNVGRFRDVGRAKQNFSDDRWKTVNSGAFMTWAEADASVNPHSRIFDSTNDVDCVVDLNVLTALGVYLQNHPSLPAATAAGVDATCKLVNSAVRTGAYQVCGKYYDRGSQFWLAFSQARASGIECLEPSATRVQQALLRRASELSANPAAGNSAEIAEIEIASKRMFPVDQRSAAASRVIADLDAKLRSLVISNGRYAYPRTKNSLYLVEFLGVRLDWYSPGAESTEILLALALP